MSACSHMRGNADYYAYADQDDVWLPNKLEQVLKVVEPLGDHEPTFYFGRAIIVDAHNRKVPGRDKAFAPTGGIALYSQVVAGNNTPKCQSLLQRGASGRVI